MGDSGEVGAHLDDPRFQIGRLLQQFSDIVVLPPWLSYMMIGYDTTIGGDEESGSEDVHAHFGTYSAELHPSLPASICGRSLELRSWRSSSATCDGSAPAILSRSSLFCRFRS